MDAIESMDSFNLTKLAFLYYRYLKSNNISYAKCILNQTRNNKNSLQELCLNEVGEFVNVYKYFKEQEGNAELDLLSFSLLLKHLKSSYNRSSGKTLANNKTLIVLLNLVLISITLLSITIYKYFPLRNKKIVPSNLTINVEEADGMNKSNSYTEPLIFKEKPSTDCSSITSFNLQTSSFISNLNFKTPTFKNDINNNKKGLFFDMTSKQGIRIWKTHLKKILQCNSSKSCNKRTKHETISITNNGRSSSVGVDVNGTTISSLKNFNARLCDLKGRQFKRIYVAELGLWMSRQKYVELNS